MLRIIEIKYMFMNGIKTSAGPKCRNFFLFYIAYA